MAESINFINRNQLLIYHLFELSNQHLQQSPSIQQQSCTNLAIGASMRNNDLQYLERHRGHCCCRWQKFWCSLSSISTSDELRNSRVKRVKASLYSMSGLVTYRCRKYHLEFGTFNVHLKLPRNSAVFHLALIALSLCQPPLPAWLAPSIISASKRIEL